MLVTLIRCQYESFFLRSDLGTTYSIVTQDVHLHQHVDCTFFAFFVVPECQNTDNRLSQSDLKGKSQTPTTNFYSFWIKIHSMSHEIVLTVKLRLVRVVREVSPSLCAVVMAIRQLQKCRQLVHVSNYAQLLRQKGKQQNWMGIQEKVGG